MERDFIREEIPLAAVFSILIVFTITLVYLYRSSSGEVLLVERNRTILLIEAIIGIVAIVYVGNKLRKRFAYSSAYENKSSSTRIDEEQKRSKQLSNTKNS